ncbi:MAG TPA: hypothetical protein PLQ93_12415, partial [Bacteroidia bacterium]|nr:hypothetical protein [Bacteroidia bacterium]
KRHIPVGGIIWRREKAISTNTEMACNIEYGPLLSDPSANQKNKIVNDTALMLSLYTKKTLVN